MGSLCSGLLVANGQDVAEPPMPNVDMETPEGRRMAAQKKAIAKFMVLRLIGHVLSLEGVDKANLGDDKTRMERELAAIPVKALEECPEDFRTMMQDVMQASREAGVSMSNLPREQRKLFEKRMEIVMEKYKIKDALEKVFEWAASPGGGGGMGQIENLVKRMKELKQGLESGTMELPDLETME